MTLIENIVVDDISVSFYNGIDFDIVMNHPKDGSKGFIFCFIENWVKEVKKWERESKINSVFTDSEFQKFNSENLDNSYIAIYQVENTEPDAVYKVVREKVLNKNFPEHPWIPMSSLNSGAWKIVNSKVSN